MVVGKPVNQAFLNQYLE